MRSAQFDRAKALALREERGFTQAELAAKASVHTDRPVHFTTISKIERGQRQPGPKLYQAICRALGVPESQPDVLLIRHREAA